MSYLSAWGRWRSLAAAASQLGGLREREQLGERKAHIYFSSKLGVKIYDAELEATSTSRQRSLGSAADISMPDKGSKTVMSSCRDLNLNFFHRLG